MILGFIDIRFLDVLDIFLVALIFYQVYQWIRKSVAMNIFIGIFLIYLFWLLVRALEMHLLSSILGQFMGVGVIALIIVFQQEIRRFFFHFGTKYLSKNFKQSLENMIRGESFVNSHSDHQAIMKACWNMASTKTGALIVLSTKPGLLTFAETGDKINADIEANLLETIFFKNSPLHDGAVLIDRNKILAARCTLPVDDNVKLPSKYGMRHISAMSMNYQTNALVITVSEETGRISYFWDGEIHHIDSEKDFKQIFKLDY